MRGSDSDTAAAGVDRVLSRLRNEPGHPRPDGRSAHGAIRAGVAPVYVPAAGRTIAPAAGPHIAAARTSTTHSTTRAFSPRPRLLALEATRLGVPAVRSGRGRIPRGPHVPCMGAWPRGDRATFGCARRGRTAEHQGTRTPPPQGDAQPPRGISETRPVIASRACSRSRPSAATAHARAQPGTGAEVDAHPGAQPVAGSRGATDTSLEQTIAGDGAETLRASTDAAPAAPKPGKVVSASFADFRYPRTAEEIQSTLREILESPDQPDMPTEICAALRRLKAYRFLAGLPYKHLALDSELNAFSLKAARICERLGHLTHTPENPGLSEEEYADARLAAGKSNLAYYKPASGLAQVVDGWMSDSDENNIERVGHRRWCLNPSMGKTGMGRSGEYSAMWASDCGRPWEDYAFIAHPRRGFTPTRFFNATPPGVSRSIPATTERRSERR